MFFRPKPWRSRAPFGGARRRGHTDDARFAPGLADENETVASEPEASEATALLLADGTDRAIYHPSVACLTATRTDASGLPTFRRFETIERQAPPRQQPLPARTAPLGPDRRTA